MYVVPVVSSIMTWHRIARHAVLTVYQVRGNVVTLWRTSFVATELVALRGLKNRRGHWLCWMSAGRKNRLM